MGAELVQDFVDGFSVCVEGDAADEEGGDVRLVPDGELLVEDDRDLGVEVHC